MKTACETHQDDLVAVACGALPDDETKRLRAHLEACPGCRECLQRLRAALSPLDAYDVQPPTGLIEQTQRRVARHMTMRLPKPARWDRRRAVRLAAAAGIVLIVGTAFLVRRIHYGTRHDYTQAQFQGLWQALDAYAKTYDDRLPPTLDALGQQQWSEQFIFFEGLSRWMTLGPRTVLIVTRRPGPDNQRWVLYRDGGRGQIGETELRRLQERVRSDAWPTSP